MAQPWKHPKTGVYWYRRAVPVLLRPLVGKREWLRTLGTKELAEAKRRYPAAAKDCEEAFRDAQAGIKRETQELTHRDIEALTAEWLRRQLVAHEIEVRPEDEEDWRFAAGNLEDEVLGGDIEDREPTIIPARARRLVKADLDALLQTEGLRVPEDSPQYEALAIKLFERKHAFAAAMATRAGGDWRQVEALERAPLWKPASDRSKTLKWAYGEWVKARKPAPRTAYEFERYIEEFGAERLVQEITAEDIRAYRDRLLKANTTANFVDKKLTPLRSVMKWLFKENHIAANPAPGIGVANLKQERQRKTRDGYTRDEARTLLTAARKEDGTLRWLPWLLAATGCRLNEVCQAVASDVTKEDGVWLLNVTDVGEGQRLKAEASRRKVPLHPALVDEGFLDYVRALPNGSRLFPEATPNKVGNWGAKLGQKYGRWLRTMIADRRKVAHSWRHSFKTWAREADIGEEKSDALTGHQAPGRVGRGYGVVPLKTLAAAIAKIDFGAPAAVRRGKGQKPRK